MAGGLCLGAQYRILGPDHLHVPPGRTRERPGVRAPVLDRLRGCLALETLHEPRGHLPVLHTRRHHRLLLRRDRHHYLEEGEDHGGAQSDAVLTAAR